MLDDGTGQRDSLLLASRELSTPSANVGVNALRVALDKVPSVGHPQSLFNLCIRGTWAPEQNILLDRAVEQDRLLADVANLLAELTQLKLV